MTIFMKKLSAPEGHMRYKAITEALYTVGLEDTSAHFLPRHKPWLSYRRTWRILPRGWEVRSGTNYILGTYRRLLQKLAVRDAWHNTDHYLVLGCLRIATPVTHSRYLRKRERFPLNPPMTPGDVDRLFVEIQEGILKPPRQEHPIQALISPDTCLLVDTSISAYQNRDGDQ